MTPQHQINYIPGETSRIFGILEISIVKAHQMLSPKDLNFTGISFYDVIDSQDVVEYSKEILYRADLDEWLSNEAESDYGQYAKFIYKESVNGIPVYYSESNKVKSTEYITTLSEFINKYNTSQLFSSAPTNVQYWNICSLDVNFSKTIAYEECSIKCYYNNFISLPTKTKKKSIVISVNFLVERGSVTTANATVDVLTKIANSETVVLHDTPLTSGITVYNSINLHNLTQI